jgi:hypothetical protein
MWVTRANLVIRASAARMEQAAPVAEMVQAAEEAFVLPRRGR